MAAALDDLAVFQHQNGVGVADGGEPVGDDKDRPAAHQAVQTPFDELFRAGVNRRGGLVQNQHRRFGNGGPRNGHQLPLALTQIGTVGDQHRVIALGHMGDEVVGVGDLRGADAVLVCGIQTAVTDILHDRSREQVGVLQNDAEGAPQVVLFDVPHVDAVIGDLSGLNVIKAVDQVGDGGLSRAG